MSKDNSDSKTMMSKNRRMRRLRADYLSILRRPDCDIVRVDDSNEHYYILWHIEGGLYDGQTHVIEIKTRYGTNLETYVYPDVRPNVRFLTSIWHNNVGTSHGGVCVDFLYSAEKWTSIYTFDIIISAIQLLLYTPNTHGAHYNSEASRTHSDCQAKYMELSKGKPLSECKGLEEKCFEPFINQVKKHYKPSQLKAFIKYFPYLAETNKIMKSPEKMAELEAYDNSKKKKTKKVKKNLDELFDE